MIQRDRSDRNRFGLCACAINISENNNVPDRGAPLPGPRASPSTRMQAAATALGLGNTPAEEAKEAVAQVGFK